MILQIKMDKSTAYIDKVSDLKISDVFYSEKEAEKKINNSEDFKKTIRYKSADKNRTFRFISCYIDKVYQTIITNCSFYVMNDSGKTLSIIRFDIKEENLTKQN